MSKPQPMEETTLPKKRPPFSAEAAAKIAVSILVHNSNDFKYKAAYDDAADVAVRLLQACQERLDKDEAFQEKDRQIALLKEPFYKRNEEEAALLEEFGDVIPFLKGLIRITGKKSEGLALPAYKRWLRHTMQARYADEESRSFFGVGDPSPRGTDGDVANELQEQRRRGFKPSEVVHGREGFMYWHKATNLPNQKRRSRRKPDN